jgi:hypothetical protein
MQSFVRVISVRADCFSGNKTQLSENMLISLIVLVVESYCLILLIEPHRADSIVCDIRVLLSQPL